MIASNLKPSIFILGPSSFLWKFYAVRYTLCAMLYALGEGLNRNS